MKLLKNLSKGLKIPNKLNTGEFNIIGRRRIWYAISIIFLLPAITALIVFGLRLGIDFTGGSVLEITDNVSREHISQVASNLGVDGLTVNNAEGNKLLLRYRLIDNQTAQTEFENQLKNLGADILRFDQVGPSVSRDLAKNAFLALGVMSLAIILYISWTFRRAPKGIKPYRFGIATVVAAFAHDGIFVLGTFAILGQLAGVEVDTFIVTAILTVVGFSIHDTVVVFDRIREKLSKGSVNLESTVNLSVNETLSRSLNTSLIIVLVLLAMLLFGAQSTRFFILALILGMVSGTYSSIFIASPLLVTWSNLDKK